MIVANIGGRTIVGEYEKPSEGSPLAYINNPRVIWPSGQDFALGVLAGEPERLVVPMKNLDFWYEVTPGSEPLTTRYLETLKEAE